MPETNEQIVLTCQVPEYGRPGGTFQAKHNERYFEVLIPENATPGQTICMVVPDKRGGEDMKGDHMHTNVLKHPNVLRQLNVPLTEANEFEPMTLMGVAREIDEKLAISATATMLGEKIVAGANAVTQSLTGKPQTFTGSTKTSSSPTKTSGEKQSEPNNENMNKANEANAAPAQAISN